MTPSPDGQVRALIRMRSSELLNLQSACGPARIGVQVAEKGGDLRVWNVGNLTSTQHHPSSRPHPTVVYISRASRDAPRVPTRSLDRFRKTLPSSASSKHTHDMSSTSQPPDVTNTHLDQMHNPGNGPGYDGEDLSSTKIAYVVPPPTRTAPRLTRAQAAQFANEGSRRPPTHPRRDWRGTHHPVYPHRSVSA